MTVADHSSSSNEEFDSLSSDNSDSNPQLLRHMIEQSRFGMGICDTNGQFLIINRAMQQVSGYSIKDAPTIESWIAKAIPSPDEAKQLLQHWQQDSASDLVATEREIQITRKDGSLAWTIVYVSKQTDDYVVINIQDITRRKAIEQTIERTKIIIDDTSDAVFWIDKQARISYVNRAACRTLGYSEAELLEMTVHDLDPFFQRNTWLPHWEDLKERRFLRIESQHRKKDGSLFPVEIILTFHVFQGQEYHCAFARDISERKATEQALLQSEELYRSFVENFQGIAYRLDTDLHPLFGHGAVEKITGYSQADYVNENPKWTQLIHPDDSNRIQTYRRQQIVSTTNSNFRQEYRIVRKDGDIHWVQETSRVIRDQSGKTQYIEGVIVDITGRKDAEAEAIKLAAAVTSAEESIIIADDQGIIQYVNPFCINLTGYSKQEMVGNNMDKLKSGKHDHTFYQNMWAVIRAGGIWRGHIINKKKDGTLFEEDATISPIRDSTGYITNYVAVKRDVTQRMQLQNQVHQSQKMAAIGQLAHRIAHNFTNALTMIMGNTQLIMDRHNGGRDVDQSLNDIMTASGRVASLTSDLLAFAHPAVLSIKNLRFDKSVIGVKDILASSLPPNVDIVFNVDKCAIKARFDPAQIEQAIVHMAINGADAMPDGGTLTISAMSSPGIPADILPPPCVFPGNTSHTAEELVVLTISDTGTGIPADIIDKVFDPFFTTHKTKRENTGLGLSTVYSIVQRHDGYVTVDSTVNKGTTFTLFFPIEGPTA